MRSRSLGGPAIAAMLLVGAAMPTSAQDVTAGGLVIHQPWARATPGGAKVAGGYLTVENRGSSVDRLTGGSFEAAQSFELHVMNNDGGVMTMRPTGPLDIPPGGSLTLSPSGKHIMFGGLKHGLKKGEQVAGTLVFEHAGTVAVQFAVEGIGARGPGAESAMPGMKMD